MAKLIISGGFVTPGEQKAADVLRNRLPKEWFVICNKQTITLTGRTYEIDFIIIGEHLIYVLEEKNLKGRIQGDEDRWIFSSGQSIPSPFRQLEMHAKTLAGQLRRNIEGIRLLFGENHFVEAFVLISNQMHEVNLQVKDPRINDRVLFLDNVCQKILKKDSSCFRAIGNLREDICEFLKVNLPDRPVIPNIPSFRIVENLKSPGRFCHTFKVVHKDLPAQARIMKLFPLNYMGTESGKKEQMEHVLRGFKAISKLSTSGLTPETDLPLELEDGAFVCCIYHLPPGRPLATIMGQRTNFKLIEAFEIAHAISKGLSVIHDNGIYHRNLSPHSIYIDGEVSGTGAIRVCFTDFELAKIIQEETIGHHFTGEDLENPYLAPELRRGLGFGTAASDLYTLGVILYELLTEGLRFQGEIDNDKLVAKLTGCDIETRAKIYNLLENLLEQDPERRLGSSKETTQEIICIIESLRKEPITIGKIAEGQYEIKRLLGESRLSSTFLAYDIISGEHCVLKCLKKPYQALSLIQGEWELLGGLDHAGIVRLKAVFPPEKPFHLKYEYIEGTPLDGLVNTAPNSIRELGLNLEKLGEDLIETLVYLEEKGVFHRDISPKNIIYDSRSQHCKFVDFGLAVTRERTSPELVGTPLYWPPEMERGEPWNDSADRYAIAIILYQLGTGKLPFPVNADGHIDKRRILPCDKNLIPAYHWEVLRKALSPDKKQRFSSAMEMLHAWRNEKVAIDMAQELPPSPQEQEEAKLSPEEFVIKAITKLRNPPEKGIHTIYSGFLEAFKKYFGQNDDWVANQLIQLVLEKKIIVTPAKNGEMIYLPGDEPFKLSHEEFVKKAILRLRKPPYKGIHSVYSGFNDAFRKYFGEDPVFVTSKLAEEGKLIVKPVRGGVMLFLPGYE